jgi:hypothetical protein
MPFETEIPSLPNFPSLAHLISTFLPFMTKITATGESLHKFNSLAWLNTYSIYLKMAYRSEWCSMSDFGWLYY